MRIETVTLAGFRCFGPDPIMVPILPEVTTVVGPNAVSVSARFDEEAIKVVRWGWSEPRERLGEGHHGC
ncbi:hypothetical protein ACU4HD_44780 (plasmid) [Cupriavidus basilensis]